MPDNSEYAGKMFFGRGLWWVDVPKWARWLARDANGTWFWYQHRPRALPGDDEWSLTRDNTEIEKAGVGTHPRDFTEQLYKITWEYS